MTAADYIINFYFNYRNYDLTHMKQSYWMALKNGNTLSLTGFLT